MSTTRACAGVDTPIFPYPSPFLPVPPALPPIPPPVGTAPDNDEGEPRILLLGIALAFGLFEGAQQPPAHGDCVLNALQARSDGRPTRRGPK